MKILLVHHELPYPIRSGWDKMVINLIRMLRTSHEVTLIVPVFRDTEKIAMEHMASICDHLVTVPVSSNHSGILVDRKGYIRRNLRTFFGRIPGNVTLKWYPELAKAVEDCCQGGRYDAIEAASILTYGYLVFAERPVCHILGPMDDGIESAKTTMQFEKHWRRRLIAAVQWRAFRYYETSAYLNSSWVLFYSEQDWRRAIQRTPNLEHARHCQVASESDVPSRAEVLESFNTQEPDSMLFVGELSPFFNQDAMIFFCNEVLPKVWEKIPEAKFYIVGHNPPPHIQNLAQSGHVTVTGGVEKEELVAYLRKASVYVGPIRSGTGVKTKIIEAMSYGKAIVAMSRAVAGLSDLCKDALLIQDDPDHFAQAVVSLLRDARQRTALGSRARDVFEREYSFEALLPKVLAVFDEIEQSNSY
jgi:glycosyltransferase involved in cell wall biosynthesis